LDVVVVVRIELTLRPHLSSCRLPPRELRRVTRQRDARHEDALERSVIAVALVVEVFATLQFLAAAKASAGRPQVA
jgi:hypothetical protein